MQYGDAETYIRSVTDALSRQPHAADCESSIDVFVSGLLNLAAVFKNPTFSEEKEWRIVVANRHESPLQHRPGKSFLVPYGALPLQIHDEHVIDEVVVGPCPHPDLSIASLKAYLASKLRFAPVVRLSNVPFRFW